MDGHEERVRGGGGEVGQMRLGDWECTFSKGERWKEINSGQDDEKQCNTSQTKDSPIIGSQAEKEDRKCIRPPLQRQQPPLIGCFTGLLISRG